MFQKQISGATSRKVYYIYSLYSFDLGTDGAASAFLYETWEFIFVGFFVIHIQLFYWSLDLILDENQLFWGLPKEFPKADLMAHKQICDELRPEVWYKPHCIIFNKCPKSTSQGLRPGSVLKTRRLDDTRGLTFNSSVRRYLKEMFN